MELVLLIILLFTTKFNRNGFAHFEKEEWNQVYFLMDICGAELFINGCRTGLHSSGSLCFSPQLNDVLVEYRMNGVVVYSCTLELKAPKILVRPDLRPVIYLLAK